MKRILAACLVALCVAPAAQAHSLRDAMAAAYRNSDILEQNRYLTRIREEGVAQQLAAIRPVVDLTARSAYSHPSDVIVSSLNLTARMQVYDNGGNALLVEAARAQADAARAGLVSLEQQVLLDAVQAYVNVWRDVQVVQVRQSNVRLVSEQLRAAEDRFEVGESTRTDVAQARAQLAGAQSALAAAQGQLEISEELFIIAVGERVHGYGAPGSLPSFPASEAEADRVARANHPAIQQLQSTVSANEAALAAARTDYGPTINLEASTGRTVNGQNEGANSQIALTLTQPIYRGGQLYSLERVALATLSASRAELNQQVRQVVQQVGNAYALLRIANAQIQSSEVQIRAAQLAFDGVQEEASLGARNTLDVLDAEQDLLNARIGRIEAQADLYIAAYTALSSMGLLTVSGLDLGVQQYDADAYGEAFANGPVRVNSAQGDRLDSLLSRIGRD